MATSGVATLWMAVAADMGASLVVIFNGLSLLATRGVSLKDAVLNGARERLRPVLMTATVAAVGLTPAALAYGLGSDVQRPLATVVVGGLISATALTLLLLPALYFVVEQWLENLARKRAQNGTSSESTIV